MDIEITITCPGECKNTVALGCGAKDPNSDFRCTRLAGHDGLHIACGNSDNHILSSWSDNDG